MDRTAAISAGCPIALSDDHITTQLPYNAGDPHTALDGSLQGPPSLGVKEHNFIIHIRVRLLQSQIHGIQFFDEPVPASFPSYEAWRKHCQHSVQRLLAQLAADGLGNSWIVAAAHNCQLLLHRPCSRNISVSAETLIPSVTAAIELVQSSLRALETGGFVIVFEMGNSAFQAGILLLYALRNHAMDVYREGLTIAAKDGMESAVCLLVSFLA